MRALLVDGHSLLYRAYHALARQDLRTSKGEETGALHGFISMLQKVLADLRPDKLAVVFDTKEKTFRHEMSQEYKATRPPTPEAVVGQAARLVEILNALGVPVLEAPGYEADDVIGTVAVRLAEAGDEVVVATGDRDLFQIVRDPLIKVLYISSGISKYEIVDEKGVMARVGVAPASYPLYLALKGDSSDNIEGVPGVGEKTARELVASYGSIDDLYRHLGELKPKIAEALAETRERLERDLELARIRTDLDIPFSVAPYSPNRADMERLKRIFSELEMTAAPSRLLSVMRQVYGEFQDGSPQARDEAEPGDGGYPGGVVSPLAISVAEPEVEPCPAPGDVVVAGPLPAGPAGEDKRIDLGILGEGRLTVHRERPLASSGPVLASAERLVGYDVKALARALGSPLRDPLMDVQVAWYLVDPGLGGYPLPQLYDRIRQEWGHRYSFGTLSSRAGEVGMVLELSEAVRPLLAELSLERLYFEVENRLIRVLTKMELRGILVDRGAWEEAAAHFENEAARLQREIIALVGHEFNVNSSRQLAEVLYKELGLRPGKRTKTGYSTDSQTLEALRDEHPVVERLLRYREMEKLRSTYGRNILRYLGPDSRFHAVFSQVGTRTGRISSQDPNLHNIPVRSPDGAILRKAFVAPPGYLLVAADYNQIELRIIAHLSGDEHLIEAFRAGKDVHSFVASRVFKVEEDQVTPLQRNVAKMVSYGLAYGMEAYGLAARLGVPAEEAKRIREAYFDAFPKVAAYMREAVEKARKDGFTTTLLGRRRPLPDIRSSNAYLRAQAERQAMNAATQGLAADIFKIALVNLDAELERKHPEAGIVLQVHDEILVEAPEPEATAVAEMTRQGMELAFQLAVPLKAEVGIGRSWAEAKADR